MLVVKSLCQKKDVVYESYVNDDMTLEDTLKVATTGIKEVMFYEKRFYSRKINSAAFCLIHQIYLTLSLIQSSQPIMENGRIPYTLYFFSSVV